MIGMDAGLRSDRIGLVLAKIDSAGPGATLAIHAGARPATGAAAGTPLVTFVLPHPCGAVAGQRLVFAAADAAVAGADGDATWARIKTASGAFALDLSAGLTGSAAEVWLDEINIQTGRTVEFVSGELTEGNP